jgi:hypothetical protein
MWSRAACYVDRILKGEKPRDLPVQAPTKYERVVNLVSVKAVGINMPETILARADEVIEWTFRTAAIGGAEVTWFRASHERSMSSWGITMSVGAFCRVAALSISNPAGYFNDSDGQQKCYRTDGVAKE